MSYLGLHFVVENLNSIFYLFKTVIYFAVRRRIARGRSATGGASRHESGLCIMLKRRRSITPSACGFCGILHGPSDHKWSLNKGYLAIVPVTHRPPGGFGPPSARFRMVMAASRGGDSSGRFFMEDVAMGLKSLHFLSMNC